MNPDEDRPNVDLSHQTGASFHTTSWTLILDARADRTELEQLLRTYWSPVYAYVRRQGYGPHDASDLTQEFLSQVVLGRNLIDRADPARGRFRSFLKQSLRNFLVDQHRTGRHSKGKGGGRRELSISTGSSDGPAEAGTIPEPAAATGRDDPSAAFDRQWAATIVQLTLERLEHACIADGMQPHWTAFEMNVVGPSVRKSKPIPLEALAKVVGAADATQVSNMLQTLKRRFRRLLRDVVAETVTDSGDVEAELAELRGLF